jgi:hypothetical protein
VSSRRRYFWRLLAAGIRRAGLPAVPRAITFAILGEHLIRYTEEEVLPRLDRALAEVSPGADVAAG